MTTFTTTAANQAWRDRAGALCRAHWDLVWHSDQLAGTDLRDLDAAFAASVATTRQRLSDAATALEFMLENLRYQMATLHQVPSSALDPVAMLMREFRA